MGRKGWIELQEINTGFDFTTDCPFWNGFWDSGGVLGRVGSDPDSASKTLKQYHQVLWSKPLPNGVTMPLVGYGTYLTSPRKTEHLIRTALEVGYRHIDTAQNYDNEHEVGLAVKHSGIVREELFITLKTQTTGYQATKKGIIQSLKAFDIEYIDLMIIHWPNTDNDGTYRALVEAYQSGIIRAIGVSNFNAHQIDALIRRFDIKPAVDQIETHVLWQQKRMHQYLVEQGIAHESWSPFGEGMDDIFRNKTLMKIGLAYGKSAAQVILRFLKIQPAHSRDLITVVS